MISSKGEYSHEKSCCSRNNTLNDNAASNLKTISLHRVYLSLLPCPAFAAQISTSQQPYTKQSHYSSHQIYVPSTRRSYSLLLLFLPKWDQATRMPVPHTSEPNSLASTAFWLILYFAFNLSLTLYNKAVMQFYSFPFPWTLTTIHTLFGTLGCYATATFGWFKPATLGKQEKKVMLAFSVLYTINIAISNVSLNLVTIPVSSCKLSYSPSNHCNNYLSVSPSDPVNCSPLHHVPLYPFSSPILLLSNIPLDDTNNLWRGFGDIRRLHIHSYRFSPHLFWHHSGRRKDSSDQPSTSRSAQASPIGPIASNVSARLHPNAHVQLCNRRDDPGGRICKRRGHDQCYDSRTLLQRNTGFWVERCQL